MKIVSGNGSLLYNDCPVQMVEEDNESKEKESGKNGNKYDKKDELLPYHLKYTAFTNAERKWKFQVTDQKPYISFVNKPSTPPPDLP